MDRKLNSNMKAIPFTNTKATERKGGNINQGEISHKNKNKIKPWKKTKPHIILEIKIARTIK